jgi:hypothetical protein
MQVATPLRHPNYMAKKLAYPLPIKGGEVLRTIQDARDYLLRQSPGWELRNHWQYACQLILKEADVKAVTWQFHRALFMDGELDLVAFERMRSAP